MITRCLEVAVKEGFYMTSNQERGGISDILLLFRKVPTSVFSYNMLLNISISIALMLLNTNVKNSLQETL